MKISALCILDRSGSMAPLTNDAIGGFNAFIEDQKNSGNDVSVTTVLFDDQYEVLYENMPVKDVPELTKEVYCARGTTALYDALGRGMTSLGTQLASLPEADRAELVIVTVITDGEENSSREYTHRKIKEMIEEQKTKYAWKFMFLCASEDSLQAGVNLGFTKGLSAVFDPLDGGVQHAYAVSSAAFRSLSSGQSFNAQDAYDDIQRSKSS